jgi:hypothetical protein
MPDKPTSRQPNLEELLSDPIIWMVMQSDGVSELELRTLLKRVGYRFGRRRRSDRG